MPPHTTLIQTTIYIQTHIHTFIQYTYSKSLAHPYVTAYIHTVWASMQTAHTEIHRSHIQAITYTWTCIDTDKHTQQISLIRIHTYMHMHTGGRWWQRAVMAYLVLNIQIGPVLDEGLHHLQMAMKSGVHQRGPSLLSETDTHS